MLYSKTCVKRPLSKIPKFVFKTNYRLMQVKVLQSAPRGHSAILSTFIKLQFVINIFVLSIFNGRFTQVFSLFCHDTVALKVMSICEGKYM